MPLFEELKRRKVIRVGLAYLVAAWLIAQVAEMVAESFGAPTWFMQMLLVLLALGLPLALFLSWAFDLTPEGLVRDDQVTPAISAQASRLLTRVTIALLVLALGYFVWESRWADRPPAAQTAAEAGSPPAGEERGVGDSIAVLPFENFSGDPADEYFADGLADTLLHKLAQLDQLTVIARNSSFQFKGQNRDIREIGQILGVDTVLEGSVQRAGNQVRIIAQLIRADDGAHLWSQSFDGAMDDIFALQDRVAQDIATQLQVDLTAEQRRRLMRDGTDDPEAYELLIRAVNEFGDYDDMADTEDTDWPRIVLLRQALERDPQYAQAWAQLSYAYNHMAFATRHADKWRRYVDESEAAARRAVELAPEQADGYEAMGWVLHRKGERLLAEQNFRKALAIEPNDLGSLSGLALQVGPTDPEEALRLLERVQQQEPTSVMVHRQKHFALSRLGRYDEAIAELRAGLEKDPGAGLLVNDLSDLLARRRGRPDEAAATVSAFLRLQPAAYEGLTAMLEDWLWANGSEEAARWAALLLEVHAGSERARTQNVERLIAAGDLQAALAEIDAIDETDDNRRWLVPRRSVICLGLGRAECTAQQLRQWRLEIDRSRERGRVETTWTVGLMLVELLSQEAMHPSADASAMQAEIARSIANEPLFDRKYYLRAGLVARQGRPEQALAILEASLADAEPGLFGLDFFGFSVENSPLVDPLRGLPAFADWLQRFEAQRSALLQRMRQMESRGEIISADSVRRLAFEQGYTGD